MHCWWRLMLIRTKTCCLLRAISLLVLSLQKASNIIVSTTSPLFMSVKVLISAAHLALETVVATWQGCMAVITWHCGISTMNGCTCKACMSSEKGLMLTKKSLQYASHLQLIVCKALY